FQAEDGIRDFHVTGVQTCALPISKYKLEYIWLDGCTPAAGLRGKTQIKEFDAFPTLEQLPLWGFDGSSTMQAEGGSSDCVLKPEIGRASCRERVESAVGGGGSQSK